MTGGAGFMGSAVIRETLQNTNHHILNVDKLTYAAKLRNLEGAFRTQTTVLPKPASVTAAKLPTC